ncbi:hypothetical protein HNP21_004986 [Bacillus aryabhattai]|jgi:hypothetical protein|uniref:Uncharacterized protein n=1 Tax=Priestia aryabhattai TaxID=412384 RepID=A0A7W3NFD7_PRIAR|nr:MULTISPECIES: hypothetical protein [Priestia]MBA9041856.1 hypothetical protein [Priestia aryabhattai]MED4619292.1 hypothetical protein [Priestia megaterium]PEZ50267.1 hypothetical protein CN367_02690 [Priestia megaterium]
MTESRKKAPHPQKTKKRDHAEQYPTENETLFDRFKIEETVDPIPTEELKIEKQDERNKKKTKNESSTENKYKRN